MHHQRCARCDDIRHLLGPKKAKIGWCWLILRSHPHIPLEDTPDFSATVSVSEFLSRVWGFGVCLGYVGKIVGSWSKLESWYLKSIIVVSTAGSIHPNMWSHQLLLKVIEPTSKVTHRAPQKKRIAQKTWLSKLPYSQYPLFQALNRHHIIDKTNLLGLLRRDGLSREEHPFHDVQRHDLFERERETESDTVWQVWHVHGHLTPFISIHHHYLDDFLHARPELGGFYRGDECRTGQLKAEGGAGGNPRSD